MPKIVERSHYNGAEERISRLGLTPVFDELVKILSDFELLISEKRDDNSGGTIREMFDARFDEATGWKKGRSGEIDRLKCLVINGARVCLGVEIQISARGGLLIRDVVHLRNAIVKGEIDLGIIVVPTDATAVFLTDRGPSYSEAVSSVRDARAEEFPLVVLALQHDGAGAPIPKKLTRQGKEKLQKPES